MDSTLVGTDAAPQRLARVALASVRARRAALVVRDGAMVIARIAAFGAASTTESLALDDATWCRELFEGTDDGIADDGSTVATGPSRKGWEAGMVACVGVRVRAPDGAIIGALCALEPLPRHWTQSDRSALHDVAAAAADTLDNSAERLAGIIDSVMDAIVTVDERQRIVRFNPAAETMFGWTAAEIAGRPLDLLIPDALRAVHTRHVQHFADSGSTGRRVGALVELTALHRAGHTFPIEASISQSVVGTARRFTAVVRDRSERKRAESALQESAERLRRLADAAFEGVCVTQNGAIVDANAALCAMVGAAPEALLGRDFLTLIAAESLPLVQHLRETDDEESIEAYLVRQDGTVFVAALRQRSTVIDGRPARIKVIQDLTERRRIEEERVRLMDDARCLLWQATVTERFDATGPWLSWETHAPAEPIAQRFFALKIPPGKSYANAFYESRPADDRVRCDRQSEMRIRSGQSYEQQFRATGADGTQHWFHEKLRVETIKEGQQWRVIAVCLDITEQKRAEEERIRVMDYARCLLWQANVFELDDDRGLVWDLQFPSDPIAQRFFALKIPPDSTYATAFYESRHPDDRVRCDRLAEPSIRSGQNYEIEYRATGADGTQRWFQEKLRVETIKEGQQWRVIAVCLDITEQRLAEEALRESERRFRTLAESLPQLIWTCDVTGSCDYISPQWLAYTGTDLVSMLGHQWMARVHPDDVSATAAAWDRATQAGTEYQAEFRLQGADGNYRWFLTRALPLRAADGKIVQWFGSNTDIHVSRELRNALHDEKERFEKIVATAPGALYSFRLRPDGTTCFPYASPRITDLCGFTPEELREDTTVAFSRLAPQDRDRLMHEIAVSARTLGPWTVQFPIDHPERGTLWIEGRAMPTREPDGGVRWFGFLTDVSDRKVAEDALRELTETLERRVAERTAQLQIANAELEAFAYSVSHDLRAPLRSINGFSQALREDYAHALDDDGLNYLSRVCAASERMGELIDDLLALSRITRAELRHDSVDLSALAAEIDAEQRRAFPERAKQVTTVVDPDLVVDGDARMLRIVLENLIGNAWKYTARHDTARIELRGEKSITDSGEEWVCCVRDDGAGFDMAYASKLFGVFQRLHASEQFEGTGVGLATVQRVIHRHGGRVWAEGAVDRGATFSFSLPVSGDR
jgi:PAS domain S-box-containing protein